jgi:HK97 family phage major capsid protein
MSDSLRETRGKLETELKEIVKKADPTEADINRYDAIEDQLQELEVQSRATAIRERYEARQAEPDTDPVPFVGINRADRPETVSDMEKAYANIRALHLGNRRAYTTGTDADVIPAQTAQELIRRLPALSAVRQAATVRQYTMTTEIPQVVNRVPIATLITEGAASQAAEGTFSKVAVKAFMTRYQSAISLEMEQDAIEPVMGEILQQHLEGHAQGWDALYTSAASTASSRTAPMGLCAGHTDMDTNLAHEINDVDTANGATVANVTIADLLATQAALPGRYRAGEKSWIMSPQLHAQIVQSTDPNSRLVFLPANTGTLQENPLSVGTILGYPVFLSDHMPAPANNAVAAILLDRQSYMIADRLQLQIVPDRVTGLGLGTTFLNTYMRSDGLWTQAERSARLVYAT